MYQIWVECTFNRLDISNLLCIRQPLSLEPVRDDQLPFGFQELVYIVEEELLIWQMTHRFRDPDAVEGCCIGGCGEEITHLLGVKLKVSHIALGVVRRVWLETIIFCELGLPVCFPLAFGLSSGYCNLLPTDGDACNFAAMLARQIARCATNSAPHVQHRAFTAQARPFKQQLYQTLLCPLFGIGGLKKVAMVDVFSPTSLSRYSSCGGSRPTRERGNSPMRAHSDV